MVPPGPIVVTKLRRPEMPDLLLSRSRLITALEAGMKHTTTTVVAPPGYGKSVAVADWARRSSTGQIAWLTLEPADNDPLRFWRHVLRAVSESLPDALPASRTSVEQGRIPEGDLFTAVLVNEMCAMKEELRLVLDDFEVITNPDVLQLLGSVVQVAPTTFRLVICSRTQPQLPVSKWRADGRIYELTIDELRLTPNEAETYLDPFVAGDLTREQLGIVVRKADGWVAGLYLAALGLARAHDVDRFLATLGHADGPIADYVVGEVLAGLSVEMRRFLLRTSFMSTLTARACDAVMDRNDSALMLRALHRHGLFVTRNASADDEWHYHPLFGELLQSLARMEFRSEDLVSIHRRAAEAFQCAGDYGAAIGHGIQSKDFDVVRALVEEGGGELLQRDPWQLYALLASIPGHVMSDWHDGRELQLWAAAVRADASQLRRLVARERALPGSPLAPTAEAALSLVEGDLPRIAAMLEDPPPSVPPALIAAGRALLADAEDRFEDGASVLSTALVDVGRSPLPNVLLLSLLAWNRARTGALGDALAYAERSIEIADSTGTRWVPAVRWAELALGQVAYDRGDLDAAYGWVMPAAESSSIDARAYVEARILASQLHWALGQRSVAAGYLASAMVFRTGPTVGVSADRVALVRAMHCVREGDVELAESWLGDWRTRLARSPASELERLVVSRLLIARGESDTAKALLNAGEVLSVRFVIEAKKALALAAASMEDSSAPLLLEVALSMAETEGFVQTFVDDASLLGAVRTPSDLGVRASVGPVQKSLVDARLSSSDRGRGRRGKLTEELTQREISVLHYLPTRMTNVEIARALFVSVNTVKSHLKAIYRKLEVKNRNDAVAAAITLRLV